MQGLDEICPVVGISITYASRNCRDKFVVLFSLFLVD
ncbi:hypothetical protein T08_1377 [Trichinella sp. T8]|nr:hypothetical protein T08_1377 [Trichinella sp. T8]